MAYTQGDLDRLDQAIASGTTEVRYSDGSSIRYRSLAEMRAIRADIAAEISGARPKRVTVAGF